MLIKKYKKINLGCLKKQQTPLKMFNVSHFFLNPFRGALYLVGKHFILELLKITEHKTYHLNINIFYIIAILRTSS